MKRFSLLIALFISAIFAKDIELEFDIPWPSGIMVDRMQHPQTNEIYRFGRLRHSTVNLRPQWSDVNILRDVLTREESKYLVDKAEAHAQAYGWNKGRHVDYDVRPTKDLTFKTLFANEPELYEEWMNKFQSKIFPAFKQSYNVSSDLLYIEDFFITRYSSDSEIENSLAPHLDKNPWSFVISLNDDFEGGGTVFVDKQVLYRPPVGSAAYFHGYQLHGAYPISSGNRYILAGFCDFRDGETLTRFMTDYDPQYDGYAGSVGFHTGDLIIGVSYCKEKGEIPTKHGIAQQTTTDYEETEMKRTITKRLVPVTTWMSDEEWLHIAQSCETLLPQDNITMRVRRFVKEENHIAAEL